MSAGGMTSAAAAATMKSPRAGEERSIASAPLLGTRLERGRGTRAGSRALPAWMERLLAIPLPAKLVGANLVLLAAGVGAGLAERHDALTSAPILATIVSALVLALLVNVALVTLAVRPVHELGRTADRVWRGDLDARVPRSLLADRDVARVGRTFNILLDALIADRARTRRLASELINAEERERATIARELHDSAAQSLAALVMQLSAATRSANAAPGTPESTRAALETAQTLATDVLEEVRLLAHTMHPRVLDDLGLVAALRRLARETTQHAAVEVTVTTLAGAESVAGSPQASVLYRVAQEAVQNALRHGAPAHVAIRVGATETSATLEVADDGRGFDVGRELREHRGMGLFTMQERVSLVDGTFQIVSRPGHGSTVIATVPLGAGVTLPARNSQDTPTHGR